VAKLNPWRLFKFTKPDRSLSDYFGAKKENRHVSASELGRSRRRGIGLLSNRVPVMSNE